MGYMTPMPKVSIRPDTAARLNQFVAVICDGNKSLAAEKLGVPRTTLYRALTGKMIQKTAESIEKRLGKYELDPTADLNFVMADSKVIQITHQVLQLLSVAVRNFEREGEKRDA